MKEAKYLGFLIGERGLRTDPSKVDAIANFPTPTSVKQTRRLLGMAGWYRRFICNYAEVTAPITSLLKKGVKFKWSEEADVAFTKLKHLLSNAPVLHNPDFSRPFFIRCDASTQGVGSVLFQKDLEENEKPIAFMSQKLNAAQRNYTVTELECLAAIISIKKFRPYIEGYRFTLITDHASLQWLMTQKELSGRLARWSLKLQGFDFNIIHQKGRDNIVPDALSRIYCDAATEIDQELTLHDIKLFDIKGVQDMSYNKLLQQINLHPQNFPILRVLNDKIFIRIEPKSNVPLTDIPCWKMWVPNELRENLIFREHDLPVGSHGGIRKTLDRLRRLYYWPKMAIQVHTYITNCDICKQTKSSNQCLRPPLGKQNISDRPWQKLYVDLLGPYPRTPNGKTMILIVLDNLTKFVYLKTLNKGTATKIVEFLREELFPLFNVPEIIHSDNGVQFTGKEFTALVNDLGIHHIKTAYYSPQSNASERVNRSIVAALRAYVRGKHSNWDKFLPEVGSALRNAIHQSINFSPHLLLFGYHKRQHANDR